MARTKRRTRVRRATSNARRTRRRRTAVANPHRMHRRRRRNRVRTSGRRRTVIVRMGNRRHKRRNPAFFGSSASPMKLAEYVAGGLIGVTINRAILPMLPPSVTSNNFFSTIAAFGIAMLEWWAASMISKDFGSAVGFGALMNAGSTALNTFIPQVGSAVSLYGGVSGRRGTGDFVNARFAVPENPILNANPLTGMSGAYPMAYGRAI